jgi:hypothetical protein
MAAARTRVGRILNQLEAREWCDEWARLAVVRDSDVAAALRLPVLRVAVPSCPAGQAAVLPVLRVSWPFNLKLLSALTL